MNIRPPTIHMYIEWRDDRLRRHNRGTYTLESGWAGYQWMGCISMSVGHNIDGYGKQSVGHNIGGIATASISDGGIPFCGQQCQHNTTCQWTKVPVIYTQ